MEIMMTLAKSFIALTLSAGLCSAAAPAFAGPQGRDTTYGAASGALAGGLLSHSVGGAVLGGVGGALIGNAIGHHAARHHRYYRHHYYRHD
jgi:hypothetical protein